MDTLKRKFNLNQKKSDTKAGKKFYKITYVFKGKNIIVVQKLIRPKKKNHSKKQLKETLLLLMYTQNEPYQYVRELA